MPETRGRAIPTGDVRSRDSSHALRVAPFPIEETQPPAARQITLAWDWCGARRSSTAAIRTVTQPCVCSLHTQHSYNIQIWYCDARTVGFRADSHAAHDDRVLGRPVRCRHQHAVGKDRVEARGTTDQRVLRE